MLYPLSYWRPLYCMLADTPFQGQGFSINQPLDLVLIQMMLPDIGLHLRGRQIFYGQASRHPLADL